MTAKDTLILGRKLLDENGLTDWTIQFDNSKRRFGQCRRRSQTISLGLPMVKLNDEERVRDTILHEIAHALTPLERGHGKAWQAKALEIGADGKARYSDDNTITPDAPFIYECEGCGYKIDRFRKIKETRLPHVLHVKCRGHIKRVK